MKTNLHESVSLNINYIIYESIDSSINSKVSVFDYKSPIFIDVVSIFRSVDYSLSTSLDLNVLKFISEKYDKD